MIKVVIGNNADRWPVIIPASTTLRQVLEDNGIDYTRGVMHIDGVSLEPGDLNKTFAQMGFTGEPGHDTTFLLNVLKTDNA